MKIAILGSGAVGQALAMGLKRNHEVRFGSRTTAKESPVPGVPLGSRKEAAAWADAVVLAVPFHAVKDAVAAVGPNALNGKVLIDATNPIGARGLALGYNTSGAEELQKLAPAAKVAKAFNTVFARHMAAGALAGERIALFVAADDPDAKRTAMALAADLGFDPVDAGPLRSARYLEPLAMQLIQLSRGPPGLGPNVALKLIRGTD